MSSSTHALNTRLGGGLRPPSEPPPGMAPAKPALEPDHLSRGARIIRFVRRQPTLVVGLVVLAVIVVAGLLAPLWWTGDPLEMRPAERLTSPVTGHWFGRSEEHTSELQSRRDLVCRLLLEKKKSQVIMF